MMLAHIADENILKSKDYIFEPKLDGFRAICQKNNGKLSFKSRGSLDMTSDYPEFNFGKQIKKDCILDGEIVVYDDSGNPSFSLMQRRSEHDLKAEYIVFDILELEGKSVRNLSLEERKKLLSKIISEKGRISVIPYSEDGKKLWEIANARNLEGVIAKRKSSKYENGRSRNWLKIKITKTVDCVIVGYKTKIRTIASLALGLYDNKKLVYIGQVGTGFNEETLKDLSRVLVLGKNNVALPKDINPVIIDDVCEVKYQDFTRDGKLRAPVYLRLRNDKKPAQCTIDQVKPGKI